MWFNCIEFLNYHFKEHFWEQDYLSEINGCDNAMPCYDNCCCRSRTMYCFLHNVLIILIPHLKDVKYFYLEQTMRLNITCTVNTFTTKLLISLCLFCFLLIARLFTRNKRNLWGIKITLVCMLCNFPTSFVLYKFLK